MKTIFQSLAALFIINVGFSQIPENQKYFGQAPPGSTPKVFAPGIVSQPNVVESVIVFSPDGSEVFLDTGIFPKRTILYSKYKNNKWPEFTIASFALGQNPLEPALCYGGNRVYFTDSQLHYSEKHDTTWSSSEYEYIPGSENSFLGHPCMVNDSSIYFASSQGSYGIYRSQYKNGAYQQAVFLPNVVNSGFSVIYWADAYVAPDESYLIFNSLRAGGAGKCDLYISYKKENGLWTNPKNLGNKINTPYEDWEGDITPDGKYMTFLRNEDLYWVSASFIDSLKLTNNIPYVNNRIKNQSDTLGKAFNFNIPDNIFIDDDGNSTLTYSAQLNNKPMPTWLEFNDSSKTFSGTLDSIGIFEILVTATDTAKAYASNKFSLKVIEKPALINLPLEQNIQVFPNPAKDKITISFGTTPYKTALVEIIDISGKKLSSDTYHNIPTVAISLNNKPKGVYMLKLTIDGVTLNKKLCIE
jgi:hypothetical protein